MLITFFCSLHRLFRLIAIHPHTKHVMIEWFRFHNPALVDSLCFNVSTFARKSDHNTPAALSASCESIKVKLRTFPVSFISSVHSMLIWLPHWDQIFFPVDERMRRYCQVEIRWIPIQYQISTWHFSRSRPREYLNRHKTRSLTGNGCINASYVGISAAVNSGHSTHGWRYTART